MTAKRAQRSRVTITLGEFRSTGAQDCANTFDADDFSPESYQTAEEAMAAFIENMSASDWISQQEDLGGHTGPTAYRAWLEGWTECALPRLRRAMIARHEHAMRETDQYYLEVPPESPGPVRPTGFIEGEIIESFDTLSDALDMLARVPSGTIYFGDAYGPDFKLVYTVPNVELLYWEADDLNTKDSEKIEMRKIVKEQAGYLAEKAAFEKLTNHFFAVKAELRRRGYKWNPTTRTSAPLRFHVEDRSSHRVRRFVIVAFMGDGTSPVADMTIEGLGSGRAKHPRVVQVDVEESKQRQGIGTKLYERAAMLAIDKFGSPLESDYDRSASSDALWQSMVRLGRAVCISPMDAARTTHDDDGDWPREGRSNCERYRMIEGPRIPRPRESR